MKITSKVEQAVTISLNHEEAVLLENFMGNMDLTIVQNILHSTEITPEVQATYDLTHKVWDGLDDLDLTGEGELE